MPSFSTCPFWNQSRNYPGLALNVPQNLEPQKNYRHICPFMTTSKTKTPNQRRKIQKTSKDFSKMIKCLWSNVTYVRKFLISTTIIIWKTISCKSMRYRRTRWRTVLQLSSKSLKVIQLFARKLTVISIVTGITSVIIVQLSLDQRPY